MNLEPVVFLLFAFHLLTADLIEETATLINKKGGGRDIGLA
jgi:hypothetical protein